MNSGNAIYIVCEPCRKSNESDFGFKLAHRQVIGGYEPFGPAKQTEQLANWFKKHRLCAGKEHPDHFLLAHVAQRDHDQPKPRPIERALKAVN